MTIQIKVLSLLCWLWMWLWPSSLWIILVCEQLFDVYINVVLSGFNILQKEIKIFVLILSLTLLGMKDLGKKGNQESLLCECMQNIASEYSRTIHKLLNASILENQNRKNKNEQRKQRCCIGCLFFRIMAKLNQISIMPTYKQSIFQFENHNERFGWQRYPLISWRNTSSAQTSVVVRMLNIKARGYESTIKRKALCFTVNLNNTISHR